MIENKGRKIIENKGRKKMIIREGRSLRIRGRRWLRMRGRKWLRMSGWKWLRMRRGRLLRMHRGREMIKKLPKVKPTDIWENTRINHCQKAKTNEHEIGLFLAPQTKQPPSPVYQTVNLCMKVFSETSQLPNSSYTKLYEMGLAEMAIRQSGLRPNGN